MNRNLITRMGTASGVVAALVATVFAVLLNATGDHRRASDDAFRAQMSSQRHALAAAHLAPGPAADRLNALSRREARQAQTRRDDERDSTHQAVVLAIIGLAGSALLILALTTYLTQYIVVPLRRVGRAATALAGGDLSARVREEGDAEPRELARSFNTMASSLQRNQAELVEQVRINRAVLDATPDPTALLGDDGSTIVQNDEMAAISHLLPPLPEGAAEVRDELQLADGRVVTRYAGPVPDALVGRIVVLRDVTAEREAERLKDEFFALVSHELRTPLTSIIGYLELVLEDAEELDDDTRRFLEVVERNAKRLLRLVGDMLFIAQVEAGRLSLETRQLDLATVAADAVEAAQPAAERAGVTLTLVSSGAPAMVQGDRDRVGQMIDNLVSNALKFTPTGGAVTVRLDDHAEGLAVVQVSDTGPGVPAAEQEHLFERFFRSSAATAAAIPGAGLGLTIVKTIAEAHGGTVGLSSVEGQGTTVRVELPAALESELV